MDGGTKTQLLKVGQEANAVLAINMLIQCYNIRLYIPVKRNFHLEAKNDVVLLYYPAILYFVSRIRIILKLLY